jgi:hypothetical protein
MAGSGWDLRYLPQTWVGGERRANVELVQALRTVPRFLERGRGHTMGGCFKLLKILVLFVGCATFFERQLLLK